MTRDNDVKGLRLQLDRQSENYQQLYTEYDRAYFDAQSRAMKLISQNMNNMSQYNEGDITESQMKQNDAVLGDSANF